MVLFYQHKFSLSGQSMDSETRNKFESAFSKAAGKGVYNLDTSGMAFGASKLDCDEEGRPTAITLCTVRDRYGVSGKFLKEKGLKPTDHEKFLDKCLAYACEKAGVPDSVTRTGDEEHLGLNGSLPKKLYHITERKNMEQILNEGLKAQTGYHNIKNGIKQVCLTDLDSLPAWTAMLDDLYDPVLLEVDASKIPDLQTGRAWCNLCFRDEPYGEYITKKSIDPSLIQEARLSKEDKEAVLNYDRRQLQAMNDEVKSEAIRYMKMGCPEFLGHEPEDFSLVRGGLGRLLCMGMDEEFMNRDGLPAKGVRSVSLTYMREKLDVPYLTAAAEAPTNAAAAEAVRDLLILDESEFADSLSGLDMEQKGPEQK